MELHGYDPRDGHFVVTIAKTADYTETFKRPRKGRRYLLLWASGRAPEYFPTIEAARAWCNQLLSNFPLTWRREKRA